MRTARLLLSVTLTLCLAFYGKAQNITTPRTASPAAEVSQTIGISKVTVNYSRPSVKGREIWGKLVPFGWNVQNFGLQNSAPWRAGANENTVITFSHDAKLEGKTIPKGSYGLFFVINEDNSGEVILSKDYKSWGSFFYESSHDLMRATIQVREHETTEMLTYEFIHADKSSVELVLSWEKKQFPVKIEFAVDDIVMANAEDELKNTVGFSWRGYNSAANYALQNNTHLEKGLEWANKAVAQNNSFTTLSTKAGILKLMGKTEEGDKIITDAIPLATEPELNLYAYQVMNQGNQDKAIELFLLNTQRFPKSANAWDSLGEGYAIKGDKKNAVKSFKKSLTLNPPANVRANSEKYLKQFGEM